MGFSVITQGTVQANGTEQNILDTDEQGEINGWINLFPMQLGDIIILREYSYIQGVRSLYKAETYKDIQTEPAIYVTLKTSLDRLVFTLQQTAGPFKAYAFEFDIENALVATVLTV
jgi:hypothetical protein